ncbi:hypothetical protein E8E11_002455 [Didymella keratinophila]|nr:hypothetical protein E8E11_002455 [Didymella keratinophila]
MAGPRINLAVTKDGETYNKLQRPNDFLDQSAASKQANERKREHGDLDAPVAGSSTGSKRAKTQHTGHASKAVQSSDDKDGQHRGGGPIAECGMRTTLPIDEEEAQYSDDSLGDALAYLHSVRSEASAIPHLLVATNESSETINTGRQASIDDTGRHIFYQDGTWIAIDESYEGADDDGEDDYEPGDPSSKDVYYLQLVNRFEALRHTLSRRGSSLTPQQHADSKRSSSTKPPSNRHEWLYVIDREYPTLSQIHQLDETSVRRGLEYCAHALDRFETISSQKSCWIWTLLALSGDVGTMDSQKMSHIRDLGTKAGGMSVDLRSRFAQQDEAPQGDSRHIDSVSLEQDNETGAARHGYCADVGEPQTGYVQSRVTEHLHSAATETHYDDFNLVNSGTSELSTTGQERATAEKRDDTLERARARLLAQLGDNLVQTGIPTSDHDTGDNRPHRPAQHDLGLDDSDAEVKVRAIPSRAEAERQRQLMRAQSSVTASLETPLPVIELSATAQSVESVDNSDKFDLNTRVTIDMILTVVAECYGQRDLLTFRKPW